MFSFIAALLLIQNAPSIDEIKELRDEEIAVLGSMDLPQKFSESVFKACVPQESLPYPKVWPAALREKVFAGEAMGDLMRCSMKKCAFNFLKSELEIYQNLETETERQEKYIEFYNDRVAGKTKIDEGRESKFIRSKDEAFKICSSSAIDNLLDRRPLKNDSYRLSHIRYNPRMRQTTRLVQGVFSPNKDSGGGFCYAEALIFSDHYDLDRVEVWKLSDKKLQLQIRHRIDLLNTWFRRLNKSSLRDELKGLVDAQLTKAFECLNSKGKLQ